VRFVQLFNGAYQTGGEGVSNWDGHKVLHQQYSVHGPVLDQPTAALLADLKQRGLLHDTLVVWCTEFGRMPTFQKGASGRDHNPEGFTCWLAGAGVKTPFTWGATDEFGYRAVENIVTVHDFHATILHLLGLDHERLTFYYNGLERRLTDVEGHVVTEVLRG
jgi:arylsulfatase A-like enzyme